MQHNGLRDWHNRCCEEFESLFIKRLVNPMTGKRISMSKYISLAAQPVCFKHCRQNAFWLTVMLAVTPVATSQAGPCSRHGDERVAVPGRQAAANPQQETIEGLATSRRMEKDQKAAPRPRLVSMVILWDEAASSAGLPGGRAPG